MKQKFRASRRAFAAIFVIAALAAVAALVAASSSNAAGPVTHPIKVQPEISSPQTKANGATQFGCQQRPMNGSQGLACYSPAQIQTAYGYAGLLAQVIDGTGRTIVIIDAYSNPYVAGDLAIQDAEFGLPSADFSTLTLGKKNAPPKFNINDPNQVGWAEEITLDVLWAHAMAPGAKIVLAEAKSNNDADILAMTQYVIDNNIGDVISQSFGEAETCVDPSILATENALFAKAAAQGQTVFASSGDSGASQFNCDGTGAILAASSPASDPNVTGVGGTTLTAGTLTGAWGGETAWTESLLGCNPPAVAFPADVNCSGGGYSTVYSRPAWQQSLAPQQGPSQATGRGVPDVAYNAGVNGGVLTHCGVCNLTIGYQPTDPVFFLFGGTSAGSPQWAALAADADQLGGHRMGSINDDLYRLSAGGQYTVNFHDVTQGTNDVAEIGTGYDATPGWDAVTGLGTPNAANLLPALAASTK
jgi:subtilase family serine protease